MSVKSAIKQYRYRRKKSKSVGAVDHVEPVVNPATGFIDWNTYIKRMFADRSKMQWLCIPCHKLKTGLETAERKKYRAARNAA